MMVVHTLEHSVVPTGYESPAYAEALADFGSPVSLPRSRGNILARPVPGTDSTDAIGPYPLFSCTNWEGLAEDLKSIPRDLVAVGLVADPFGEYRVEDLKRAFPDVCFPFKTHFVVDLSLRPEDHISRHHRRNARASCSRLEVSSSDAPNDWLDCWLELYGNLIQRHRIQGIAEFSRNSFEKQLRVPGITAFRAVSNGETIGMLLWYVQRGIAYYHLGAYSDRGYELGASFALFRHAINFFRRRELTWLNLGGGAGLENRGTDGLSRFKRGWATGTKSAWFCGRVLNSMRYVHLVRATGTQAAAYFPAYRAMQCRSSLAEPAPVQNLPK